MAFVKVAQLSEIKEGRMKTVAADGDDVCLINSGGSISQSAADSR